MDIKKLNEELKKVLKEGQVVNEVSDEWKQARRDSFVKNRLNPSRKHVTDIDSKVTDIIAPKYHPSFYDN